MGRWIGIDYGTRRIGVAIADQRGIIANPAATLASSGTAPGDARLILDWAADNEADGVVVGLPLNMDGSDSDQTRLTRRLADELRKRGSLSVETWDERLTSFQADLLMDVAELSRSRRKTLRDAIAAQVILQSFLDARRATDGPGNNSAAPGD